MSAKKRELVRFMSLETMFPDLQLLERGADYSLQDRHGYDLAKEMAMSLGAFHPGSNTAK